MARLVQQLDGLPLAIELAAARVEALGLAQLLGRLDDRSRLLVSASRAATARQRSLEAAVEWSYQLLSEPEQQAFRRLAVFPGPFTLRAAEAVAGTEAGSTVLRLVDCSLLVPPATGPDGRSRYLMLQTLRDYGRSQLRKAGEEHDAAAALAVHALDVAEQAAALMAVRSGEKPALLLHQAHPARRPTTCRPTRAAIRPVRRSASSTTSSVGRCSRSVAAPSRRWSSASPASHPATSICTHASRPSRVLPDPPPPVTSSTGLSGGPWHQPVI